MKNFSLLSHDVMLANIQEKHNQVLHLTQQLEEARSARDEAIYDANQEAQISLSRIARAMGSYPANLKQIIQRIEQKRAGLR